MTKDGFILFRKSSVFNRGLLAMQVEIALEAVRLWHDNMADTGQTK